MSASEWDDFENTIKKIMREFYEKIEGLKVKLTDQEYKVCLLTRLEFSSTDISNLLGTSQQRVTNIKSSINGAPDKPCGVGRADANPKLLLNDT